MESEEIVKGLAEALELERELGVRSVEIDRSLLAADAKPADAAPPPRLASPVSRPQSDSRLASPVSRPPDAASGAALPLAFLHDRALSAKGVEMMAKILAAMKLSPETAPILFTGTLPSARAYVVLGHNALKKWFPGQAGAPGQWISPAGERNVLVTYSPEYILRFGVVTPAVKKLKMDMWTSLKSVMQRMDSSR